MNTKDNNAWFFGDSFTTMNVLRSQWYTEYKKDNSFYERRWSSLISNHLQLNEKNFAEDGMSNEFIYNKVMEKIPSMKFGDYCFIQGTVSTRILSYSYETNQIESINSEFIEQEWQMLQNLKKHIISNNESKTIHSFINYINDLIIPHIDIWNVYYDYKYKLINDILEKMGVNCIYISYKHWPHFQTIKDETHGVIDDEHWGENGNYDFFQYLWSHIDSIRDGIKNITLNEYIKKI